MAAEELAKIAGIDVTEFAKSMFAAGSNLSGKTPEAVFYQDFKKFNINETEFGVGQISSMNSDELAALKEKLLPYMEKVSRDTGVGMTENELLELKEKLQQNQSQGTSHRGIGLGNIYNRVNSMYKGGYVDIYSKSKIGTVIKVVIPQKNEERYVSNNSG